MFPFSLIIETKMSSHHYHHHHHHSSSFIIVIIVIITTTTNATTTTPTTIIVVFIIIIIIQPLSIFSERGEHTRFVLKNQLSIADSFQVVYCAQFFRQQCEIIILQGHHWTNSTSSLATQRRWSLPKSRHFATIAKESEKDCCCGRRI